MPKSKFWVNKTFSISVEDAETLIPEIDKIARREGVSRSAIVVTALKEYWKIHRKGNYQHYMTGFLPGGVKSDRQIEQDIINYFMNNQLDVKYSEVAMRIRSDLGYKGKSLIDAIERIVKKLHDNGVKIWK